MWSPLESTIAEYSQYIHKEAQILVLSEIKKSSSLASQALSFDVKV